MDRPVLPSSGRSSRECGARCARGGLEFAPGHLLWRLLASSTVSEPPLIGSILGNSRRNLVSVLITESNRDVLYVDSSDVLTSARNVLRDRHINWPMVMRGIFSAATANQVARALVAPP